MLLTSIDMWFHSDAAGTGEGWPLQQQPTIPNPYQQTVSVTMETSMCGSASVRPCVLCACVRACVHACVRVCLCVWGGCDDMDITC